MGDKTILGGASSGIVLSPPPLIAGIDLPLQVVMDSYNLYCQRTGHTGVLHWAIDIAPGEITQVFYSVSYDSIITSGAYR